MEYPPKKVKIQNLRTGKITETTVVAVEVMKKHGLFKGYEVINGEQLPKLEEIPAKKTKKPKPEITTETIVVDELPTEEPPVNPEINQNIIE